MTYFLIFPDGTCEQFYILACARIYQSVWDGELVGVAL